MSLRAVLFDLDGTLIDSHDDILAAVAAAALENGFEAPAAQAVRELVGLPLALMFRTLLGQELSDAAVASLASSYRSHFGTSRTRVFAGVHQAIAAIAPHALLGIATTKRTSHAESVVTALSLQAHFHVVQGTDDFPAKPAPDVLLHALARLEVPPEQAAYVGDGPWDMKAARAGRLLAIGVNHAGDRRGELLAAGALRVLRAMDDLPPLLDGLY